MRILAALTITALFSTPILASDLGQYRPGTPYSSSLASGADVCESHCSGDAQCRAWNYVKPNPRVSGVCEFLSSSASPIPSQISISGVGVGLAMASPRLMQGRTNTVRVGTQPVLSDGTITAGKASSGRRVTREPVPQRAVPRPASIQPSQNMSLSAQQALNRQASRPHAQHGSTLPAQAFRPILDATVGAGPRPRVRQRPVRPATSRRVTGPRQIRPQPSPGHMSRPMIGQPIAQPALPMQHRSVAAPRTAPVLATPRQETNSAIALDPAQARRSLFGRLNDDMPVATSVPSVPVTTQPMDALAGGR